MAYPYADATYFEAYAPNFNVTNPTALEDVLVKASRDVEYAVGRYGRDETTSQKFDPTVMTAWQLTCLKNAVCAQAEYRMMKGEEFFVNFRPQSTSGPDGRVEGKEPYLAPRASLELTQGRLFKLWGGRGQRPMWYPNQNIGDDLP